jgi:hypothetical protein
MPSEDQLIQLIAVVLPLAHAAALIAVLRSRARFSWIVNLNLLVSAGVMIYWAPRVSQLFGYVDMVMAFVGFELAVLVVSVLARLRVRIPNAVHWIAFAANTLLSVNALIFMLTFRITRLM